MTPQRELTELLGVTHPVVLGPFGGASSVPLTAAVSELGGLGSFGLYGYDGDRIREVGAALREATARPFALNLWLPMPEPARDGAAGFAEAAEAARPLFEAVGAEVPARPPAELLPSFEEQWEAVVAVRPAVASFIFGVPPAHVIRECRDAGIRVIGSATTPAEARALAEAGVDAIVAAGFEAAGHRPSFLHEAERSLVGTFSLVPQVVDAVDVPVIATGGIADRRGVAAAVALGAAGVQAGTAFLRTTESAIGDAYRAAIAGTPPDATVLTRAMSGRLARGARNAAVAHLEAAAAIAPFPLQNWLTGRFRTPAGKAGRADLQSVWMGQSAALAVHDRAADVFAELVAGLPA
ncbi:NAD(P)H-dependent flavin oxidoreductase [Agromyces aerolatus]|uniref:NAD(P)H-dependent flavin oxidoreductase n=1 Tax=Agromyces sp. LY-1074 TaxID=3074080 RepID=UPI002862A462|nr:MULTISPECIES: nitronate monooxygenase [unclassified Agromyces]MDR5699206.1 nitronate monooxygenase [Agromyces sp. LY-1074]MDR5705502.1 nitronate monooxygenase [Agromyces sp. LY-1358]